ncbi:hypothetical protein [Stappia indica]|uniref:ArsR family transcriptional regulator n=1 Tax=Stappia indica TaxID=538381 RepID=A0A285TYY1_9HYPH|nr:hypothetical protein [Stappia indica]SOC27670.1 hypothetical protein SAMN05421512_12020 [Stappia indica]
MSFAEHVAADCRLIILRALAEETDQQLNETILVAILETFGHRKSREYVRTQLRRLAELDAVRLTEAGTIFVATLRRAGLDHVQRRALIEGVGVPSPEA